MIEKSKKKNPFLRAFIVYLPMIFSVVVLMDVILPKNTSVEMVISKDGYRSTTYSNNTRNLASTSTEIVRTIITNESEFRCPKSVYQSIEVDEEITIEKSRIFGEVYALTTEKYTFDNLSGIVAVFYWKPAINILLSIGLIVVYRRKKKWNPFLAYPNFFLALFIVLSLVFDG